MRFPLPIDHSSWVKGADPSDRASYFAALSGGINPSTAGQPGDVRGLIGMSGITLAPSQQLVVYFAVVMGTSRTSFDANVATAKAFRGP